MSRARRWHGVSGQSVTGWNRFHYTASPKANASAIRPRRHAAMAGDVTPKIVREFLACETRDGRSAPTLSPCAYSARLSPVQRGPSRRRAARASHAAGRTGAPARAPGARPPTAATMRSASASYCASVIARNGSLDRDHLVCEWPVAGPDGSLLRRAVRQPAPAPAAPALVPATALREPSYTAALASTATPTFAPWNTECRPSRSNFISQKCDTWCS